MVKKFILLISAEQFLFRFFIVVGLHLSLCFLAWMYVEWDKDKMAVTIFCIIELILILACYPLVDSSLEGTSFFVVHKIFIPIIALPLMYLFVPLFAAVFLL